MNLFGRRQGGSLVSKWDTLRSSYWFVPMVMVVAAAGLALGLVELDDRISGVAARRLPWIHAAGAEGTRAVLSTVAGSMITVTGVVFSITIVALTLASSQFGPRLLRNFLRDRGNQLVLGTFVSTFLYSLLVLRAVETDAVPYLATAAALVLAVTSVFVLIYFVHHAASSIQASSIIASVAHEIDGELATLFPETVGAEAAEVARDEAQACVDFSNAREVVAAATGYVRVLGAEKLLGLAVEHDLTVDLTARPGDFVSQGEVLARVVPADRCSDDVASGVSDCFVIGIHRTAVQDLEFLTDQLAEMAVRALSPGTNDPKTAVACLHRLGAVIATVSNRRMPGTIRRDEQGELRVIARPTTFAGVVSSCLDPIRRYGIADAEVVETALLALAKAAAQCTVQSRRDLLLEYAREWLDGFAAGTGGSRRDRDRVIEAFARVEKSVAESEPVPG